MFGTSRQFLQGASDELGKRHVRRRRISEMRNHRGPDERYREPHRKRDNSPMRGLPVAATLRTGSGSVKGNRTAHAKHDVMGQKQTLRTSVSKAASMCESLIL